MTVSYTSWNVEWIAAAIVLLLPDHVFVRLGTHRLQIFTVAVGSLFYQTFHEVFPTFPLTWIFEMFILVAAMGQPLAWWVNVLPWAVFVAAVFLIPVSWITSSSWFSFPSKVYLLALESVLTAMLRTNQQEWFSVNCVLFIVALLLVHAPAKIFGDSNILMDTMNAQYWLAFAVALVQILVFAVKKRNRFHSQSAI